MMMEILESKILNEDNNKIIPNLPKEFFRLILTDPPYEISRDSNFHTMNRSGLDFGDWDKNFDQLSWIESVTPSLMSGGSIVIFNDWKKLGRLADLLESLEFQSIRPLIWHKTNPRPANASHVFLQSTEFAIWATKKKHNGSKTVFNSKYHHGIFDSGVLSIDSSLQRSAHPTKKPNKLFNEIINILTNPGEWILDPFLGSGTTAICAKQLKRNYFGIERNEDYFKLAQQGLANG